MRLLNFQIFIFSTTSINPISYQPLSQPTKFWRFPTMREPHARMLIIQKIDWSHKLNYMWIKFNFRLILLYLFFEISFLHRHNQIKLGFYHRSKKLGSLPFLSSGLPDLRNTLQLLLQLLWLIFLVLSRYRFCQCWKSITYQGKKRKKRSKGKEYVLFNEICEIYLHDCTNAIFFLL